MYSVSLPLSISRVFEGLSVILAFQLDLGPPLHCLGLRGFLPVLVTYLLAPMLLLLAVWLVSLFITAAGLESDTWRRLLVDASYRALPALLPG